MEKGKGGYGIRGVVPVAYEGNHLGSFEFGLAFNKALLSQVKEAYQADLSVYLNDTASKVETFTEENQGAATATAGFSLLLSTTEDPPTVNDETRQQVFATGEPTLTRFTYQDVPYAVFTAPIRDYAGDIIGLVEISIRRDAALAEIARSRNTSLAVGGGIMLVLAIFMSWFLRWQIVRPLQELAQASENLATGDVNVEINVSNRNDEIGMLAQSFQKTLAYFQEVANAARQIAAGNLSTTMTPRSANDVLGHAFETMVADLQQVVDQITTTAAQVDNAAQQLTIAAGQSGSATEQVANTIQQIALGSTAQSDSVSKTTTTLNQVLRAIDGVAQGAQEQAAAVARTAELTTQLTDIIQQVHNNAQSGAAGSAEVAQAARSGAKTIKQAIAGMTTIKSKVGQSAQKVQEMGRWSEEIGNIVETIESIASQTNLLALNAAIESARTGVQARQLAESLLNHHLVTQAQLIAELLTTAGNYEAPEFWGQLARRANIDNICITDEDGVIVYSDDLSLLGFRFPDDPKSQTYEFRQLLYRSDGVVHQETQRRAIDNELFKYVGVSRRDQRGIVQVGFKANTLAQFQLQVGGFSVVADEVRKLAEKSALAAKEIAELIGDIQQSVTDAVKAMEEGTVEVESGVMLADQAGEALENILRMVEDVNRQVANIATAAQKMKTSSNELVDGMETVSAVIEENTAATQEMAAGASEVLSQIEDVAKITLQNSTAIEEVSAGAEEMNAQVEEGIASAQVLGDMAQGLKQLVSQFTLNGRE